METIKIKNTTQGGIWKVGTNISSYATRFYKWMKDGKFSINEKIEIFEDDGFLSIKNNKITLKTNQEWQPSTIAQIIKIWLTLDLIKFIKDPSYTLTNKELLSEINCRYIINAINIDNASKNFIDFYYKADTINEFQLKNNEEEENIDEVKIEQYSGQRRSLNSLFRSIDLLINKGKSILYWDFNKSFSFNDSNKSDLLNISARMLGKNNIHNPNEKKKQINLSDFKEEKNKNITVHISNIYEILSNEELTIKIPLLQRRYVWRKDLILSLIDDAYESGKKNKYHFISSIVYNTRVNKNEYRILDGQQRLISILIIISSLNSIYDSDESKKNGILKPKFLFDLFYREGNSYTEISKKIRKQGMTDESEIITEFLNGAAIEDGHDNSGYNIKRNFESVKKHINKKMEKYGSNKEKQELLDTYYVGVMQNLVFSLQKNNDENEFSIFEKLNTSSMSLNNIDLIKNTLLSFIEEKDLDYYESEIQHKFYDEVENKFIINGVSNDTLINNFITFFIITSNKEISDVKINFKEFSNAFKNKFIKSKSVQDKINYLKFNKILKEFGELINEYLNLTKYENIVNEKNPFSNFSDFIYTFHKRPVYTSLLWLIIKTNLHTNKEIEKLDVLKFSEKNKEDINRKRLMLLQMEKFEIAMQIAKYRGQSLTQMMISIYSYAQSEIFNLETSCDEKVKKFKKVFKGEIQTNKNIPLISKNYLVSDVHEEITKEISSKPVVKKVQEIVLNRLNSLRNNDWKIELNSSLFHTLHSQPSIEHIMPQELKGKWIKQLKMNETPIWKNEYNKHLNMIGNIMIMDNFKNSKISNKDFEVKKNEYKNDSYLNIFSLNYNGFNKKNSKLELKEIQLIADNEWNFETIEDRSNKISIFLEKYFDKNN